MKGRVRIALFTMMLMLIAASVTVYADNFAISRTKVTVNVGDTVDLDVTGTEKVPRWTSWNINKVKVDQNGEITALRTGKTTVSARVGLTIKKCSVTVVGSDIKLDKSKATIYTGGTSQKTVRLKATVKGASDAVTWRSSDESVATVDTTGKVTSVAAGEAVIWASANGKTASCVVTVKDSAISLNMDSMQLSTKGKGSSIILKPTITGTSKAVKWTSSDKKVATVDKNGKVTGKKSGTAVIEAVANGVLASCTVNVIENSISIGSEKELLYTGEEKTLKCNAGKNDVVTWSSSNTLVASVDETGKVTTHAAGTAIITASLNDTSDSCEITVKDSVMSIEEDTIFLKTKGADKTYALNYSVIGRDTSVKWISSDKNIATVSKGKITAKKAGVVTITASGNGLSDSVEVTVAEYNPTITLNQPDYILYTGKGKTYTLTATVDGPSKSVVWSSDNPTVATVNKNGKVTAVSEGETIIRATANDVSAECRITVIESKVILETNYIVIDKGEKAQIPAEVIGKSQTITYKSVNSKIAKVNNGIITGKNYGEVDIKVTANGVTSVCHVTVGECQHVYGEGVVTKEASCTELGVVLFTCTKCGNEYIENIPLTSHVYEAVVTEPTCVSQGYTTYLCRCGDTYVDNYVDAMDHDWGEWKTVVEATEDTEGLENRVCKREGCETEDARKLPKKEHEHVYEAKVTEPTCTEKGFTTYTCQCGETYVDNYTEVREHEYKAEVTEPTCTQQGYTTHTCHCGDSYVDNYVEMLAHEYNTVYKKYEPTCINAGWTLYMCKCGKTERRDIVDALGHNLETVITKEATCTERGIEQIYCTRCDMEPSEYSIPIKQHSYVEIENTVSEETGIGHISTECEMCKKPATEYYVSLGEAPEMLFNGQTYQLELESDLDEKLLPYVSYQFTARYYNEYNTEENIMTISDTGLVTIDIKEHTNTEQDLYAYVKVVLKENPYGAVIKQPKSFMLEIGGYKNTLAYAKIRDEIVPQIITADMGVADKVLEVHDWICDYMEYDYNYNRDSYEAYGSIISGKAVCSGYAKVFDIFMSVLDIPAVIVSSWELNHAWNMVQIDGEWYWLDTTWDDPTADWFCEDYKYYLVNGVRVEDEEGESVETLPECTGEKWRVKTFDKYHVSTQEEILDSLIAQKDEKRILLAFHSNGEYREYTDYVSDIYAQFGYFITDTVTEEENITVDGECYENFYIVKILPDERLKSILALLEEEGTHQHVFVETRKEPTCLENGYIKNECYCGYVTHTTGTSMFALGHDWDEWITTVEPTETLEGEQTRTCLRCEATETQTLDVIHVHAYEESIIEATCTEQGYTAYTCSCGDSYTINETDALGHDEGTWTTTVEPKLGVDGKKELHCNRCNTLLEEDKVDMLLTDGVDSVYTVNSPDGYVQVIGHYGSDAEVQKMFELVNELRVENGKQPFTMDYQWLVDDKDGAKVRAAETAYYWEHWGCAYSENIAYTPVFYSDYDDMEMVQKVFDSWVDSEGHKNNMLNAGARYNTTGIAVFYKKVEVAENHYLYERYWVQVFD